MNEGGTKSYNIWEKICRWFWDRLKAMGESLYDYFIDDYEADEHRWGCFWIVVVIVILGCLGGCVRSCIRKDNEEDAKREAWVKSNYKIEVGSLLENTLIQLLELLLKKLLKQKQQILHIAL